MKFGGDPDAWPLGRRRECMADMGPRLCSMLSLFQAGQAGRTIVDWGYNGPRGVLVFGKGNTSAGNYQITTSKYNLSSDAAAAGTSFTAGRGVDGTGSSSSGTVGYWYQGYDGSNRNYVDKYTFSGDTTATGTNSGQSYRYVTASGMSTLAINAGTDASNSTAGATRKYTYSGDTDAAGTAFSSFGPFLSSAAGNASVGIWGGWYNAAAGSNATRKYTYSGDTTAAGTSLSSIVSRMGGSAMGSFSVGYYNGDGGAANTHVDKYTYSNDSVAAGTDLTYSTYVAGGCSDPGGGIFLRTGAQSTTQKYTFHNDVVAAGTNLDITRTSCSGASSVPGGF